MIEDIFKRPAAPAYEKIKPSADPPNRSSFTEFMNRQDGWVAERRNRSVHDDKWLPPTTHRKTPRVLSSRTKDLLTAVVGGRSVLSKCDLDLILRRFLIRPTPELCRRIEIDDGTFDVARLVDLLANAEASPADPLHSLVVAALSNLRSAIAIPRRRQSKGRPKNWTRPLAEPQAESPKGSPTPKETRTRPPPSPRAAATNTTGERYLPKFYDDLDR
jgi:hypothetical protein